jgi:hypothetical protein
MAAAVADKKMALEKAVAQAVAVQVQVLEYLAKATRAALFNMLFRMGTVVAAAQADLAEIVVTTVLTEVLVLAVLD